MLGRRRVHPERGDAAAGGGQPAGHGLRRPGSSPPDLFKGPQPQITPAPDSVNYGGTFEIGTAQPEQIATVSLIRDSRTLSGASPPGIGEQRGKSRRAPSELALTCGYVISGVPAGLRLAMWAGCGGGPIVVWWSPVQVARRPVVSWSSLSAASGTHAWSGPLSSSGSSWPGAPSGTSARPRLAVEWRRCCTCSSGTSRILISRSAGG